MEQFRIAIWQVWDGTLGGLLLISSVPWLIMGLKFVVSFLDPDHWAGAKELAIGIVILLLSVGLIFCLTPR